MLNILRRHMTVALTLLALAQHSFADQLLVPSDYPTIQAAIDAAQADDTIMVAGGIYHERIKLKPGVTLKSVGDDSPGKSSLHRAETTILDGGGKTGQGAGVTMADHSTLDGFTVRNVGVFDEIAWQKHHATQGNEQDHQHIGQPGTPGIDATNVSCRVINNIVHHNGYSGIAISGPQAAPRITKNTCFKNLGAGIASMNGSRALISENTCFQNFYAGIGHENASPTVTNNHCYENIRAGIGISEGACPVVRSNRCYRNRRAGIGTRSGAATKPIIEDNDCYENDMAGIGTEEHAAPIIRNNRCYKNLLAGIGSQDHATATIIGNECSQNQKAGIGQQSDAHTTLINNHCHDNQTAGIGFEACENGTATVIGNRVNNNQLVAVGIHSGWNVRLVNNQLSRETGLPPIVMIFAGASVQMSGNTIRGGGVAGIRVAGNLQADNNVINGIAVRPGGPPNFAIWALPDAKLIVRNNQIQRWRHGLYAEQATVTATENQISEFHNVAFAVKSLRGNPTITNNVITTKNRDAKIVGDASSDIHPEHNQLIIESP